MKICWKSFWIGFAICYLLLGWYFGNKYAAHCIETTTSVNEPKTVYTYTELEENKRN